MGSSEVERREVMTDAERRIRHKAQIMAQEALGCYAEVRFKTGVTGTAVARGTVVKCEVLQPRVSRSGGSLLAYWKMTIKLSSGKLHEATVNKLPRRKAVNAAAVATERPDWNAMDELVKIVTKERRRVARGRGR